MIESTLGLIAIGVVIGCSAALGREFLRDRWANREAKALRLAARREALDVDKAVAICEALADIKEVYKREYVIHALVKDGRGEPARLALAPNARP